MHAAFLIISQPLCIIQVSPTLLRQTGYFPLKWNQSYLETGNCKIQSPLLVYSWPFSYTSVVYYHSRSQGLGARLDDISAGL